MSHHEVDILLSCTCIVYEQIEGVIFTPRIGEARHCKKHNQNVTISRVGYPYYVEDSKEPVNTGKQVAK